MLTPNDRITFENETVEARTRQAYHDLSRWIRWFASISQIPGHWCMNRDDLTGECYYVLAKVSGTYSQKPYPEFIILAKASMRNAVRSLRYKLGVTHRKAEINALSLNTLVADSHNGEEKLELGDIINLNNCMDTLTDSITSVGIDPAIYVEAAERFLDMAEKLSILDLEVLDAILGNDTRASLQIQLAVARKNFVYSNPSITITPALIARALGYPLDVVEASFQRIKAML